MCSLSSAPPATTAARAAVLSWRSAGRFFTAGECGLTLTWLASLGTLSRSAGEAIYASEGGRPNPGLREREDQPTRAWSARVVWGGPRHAGTDLRGPDA